MAIATPIGTASGSRAVARDRAQRPIRIAHVQLLPILTGVQRVTVEEVLRLDRSLYEPYVICRSPGPLTELLEREGVGCLFAPALVRPIAPIHDLIALRQLVGLMRRYRFDLVHTHSSKTGVLGRFAARLAGVPVVLHTVHGFAFPASRSFITKAIYGAMEWSAARCCDGVICLTPEDKAIMEQRMGMEERRVHLVPNGVDLARFRPVDAATRQRIRQEVFGVSGRTPVIGMLGRLSRQKNPLGFVQAADAVLSAGTDVKFVLISDGELRHEVETAIRERGRQGSILALGWCEPLPELLASLDVFALPSLWEGMPLALLEAMASGLPVVASDIVGNRAVVTDGKNGLLAPPEPIRFAERLIALCEDPFLRSCLGEAARRTMEAAFDIEKRFEQIVALYGDYCRAEKVGGSP